MGYADFLRQQCYIDGQWCDADSGKSVNVTDPGTGKVLGTVPNMGEAETARAIAAAEKALPQGELGRELPAAGARDSYGIPNELECLGTPDGHKLRAAQ